MNFGRNFVPAEILVEIIQCLSKKDIKSVRRTSKGLNDIATRYLFGSVYISSRLKDREAFTAISDHPVFSHLVTELVYDSTNISFLEGQEQFNLNRTSYTRFLTGCQSSPRPIEFSKAALGRGFKSFAARFQEHLNLAEYDGEELTHWSPFRRPPFRRPPESRRSNDNFSSLLMDNSSLPAALNYLPDDLVRLLKGIPQMPNLKHFVISDTRYAKNTKHRVHSCWDYEGGDIRELTLTINKKGVRGADEIILDPRPWPSRLEEWPPSDCDRTWYRGFPVLMQAASMLNMTTLESFTVERDCPKSGISHVMFHMSPQRLRHTINAFSNLKTIQLKIHTTRFEGMRWRDTVASGCLMNILEAARHLQDLDLRLDSLSCETDYLVPFGKIVGVGYWPSLRKVALANMALSLNQNGFLEFFDRHRQTLCDLWVEDVMILSDTWSSNHGPKQIHENWIQTFRSMASDDIRLRNFSFLDTYLPFEHNL
ncbi:hypothetical protein MMC31_003762, partial [Peltigera leucophlebia]|nr:hypothetical protein [Peltigera leucophlebia]